MCDRDRDRAGDRAVVWWCIEATRTRRRSAARTSARVCVRVRVAEVGYCSSRKARMEAAVPSKLASTLVAASGGGTRQPSSRSRRERRCASSSSGRGRRRRPSLVQLAPCRAVTVSSGSWCQVSSLIAQGLKLTRDAPEGQSKGRSLRASVLDAGERTLLRAKAEATKAGSEPLAFTAAAALALNLATQGHGREAEAAQVLTDALAKSSNSERPPVALALACEAAGISAAAFKANGAEEGFESEFETAAALTILSDALTGKEA